jgi:hypothetical protein
MGKLNDNIDIEERIPEEDFANLFNINPEPELTDNAYTYSINRTLNLTDIPKPGDNVSGVFFEYEVSAGETWTLISYKIYGTIRLWWLVCKLNNIKNPTVSPETGQRLVLIDPNQVFNVLNQIKIFE